MVPWKDHPKTSGPRTTDRINWMQSEYTIMPATSKHLAAIPVIELAAAALFSEDDLPPEVRFLVTHQDDALSAQVDGRVWVAVTDDGTVVGFAISTMLDGNAHLDEVNVLPQHSGKGVGRGLIEAVTVWARSEGFHRLTLVTFRHVLWNAPFYRRIGFEQVSDDDIGEEIVELLVSEKKFGIDIDKRLVMEKWL